MTIDYRILLLKYIVHVWQYAGSDCIGDNLADHKSDVIWTKEEAEELQRLAEESCGLEDDLTKQRELNKLQLELKELENQKLAKEKRLAELQKG